MLSMLATTFIKIHCCTRSSEFLEAKTKSNVSCLVTFNPADKALMRPSSIHSKGFRKIRRGLKKKMSAADESFVGTEGYLTD